MSAKCSVCGYESSDRNPHLQETYKGKTYEFCCPLCQSTFTTIPEQFTK